MPRPKKTELSKAVSPGTKRGNPDFVSSSFYVPKKINLQFDRAILTLKANGYEVDRSDILSVLMDQFATAVDAVERQGGDVDLESILASATENVLDESAEVSGMISQMKASFDELKAQRKESDRMMADAMKRIQEWDAGRSSAQGE